MRELTRAAGFTASSSSGHPASAHKPRPSGCSPRRRLLSPARGQRRPRVQRRWIARRRRPQDGFGQSATRWTPAEATRSGARPACETRGPARARCARPGAGNGIRGSLHGRLFQAITRSGQNPAQNLQGIARALVYSPLTPLNHDQNNPPFVQCTSGIFPARLGPGKESSRPA